METVQRAGKGNGRAIYVVSRKRAHTRDGGLRVAVRRWRLLSLARRCSADFARVVFGSLGAATRSTPLRRGDQMCFAYGVVSGVMSPPTATRPRGPGVLSALRSMLRGATVARLRVVGWEEAVCAHTLQQSVRTVGVLTAQGPMPAQPGRSPSTQRGGGGRRPHHGGSRGGRLLVLRRQVSRRRASRRSRVPPSRRWRRWRSRGLVLWGRRECLVFFFFVSVLSVFFFSFCVGRTGEKEISGTLLL